MCGIVGYKGKNNAIPILLSGLKSLEYRGFDSAGIAYLHNKQLKIIKSVGKVSSLEEKVSKDAISHLGIAHTRWATHGGVTEENAHPHTQGKITLVHNGIIENYLELKKELVNYTFLGSTDSEVLAAQIDKLYNEEKDMLKALARLKDVVIGSYALLIINSDEKDTLYAIRYNSPLIAAQNGEGYFLASDVPAILKHTNKYFILDNNEIVKIKDDLEIYNADLKKINKKANVFDKTIEDAQKGQYKHFMLKEIHEEPKVVQNILDFYLKDNSFTKEMPDFKEYKKIMIVGCGSAYYTGEIVKTLYEKYLDIPVETCLASEFRYQKLFYNKETLVIFISQSGETADTLEALRKAKKDGIDTLAIVNSYASSIAREADHTLYIKAGVEIAVATTKAFVAQICVLLLVLIKMSNRQDLIKYLYLLPLKMAEILQIDLKNIAQKIYKHSSSFYIGRGLDYGLCEEGSLKLKEISYINSSAFPSGELKHGSISLIEKNTPVIGVCSNKDIAPKVISNLKEAKARGAYTLIITCIGYEDSADDYITVPYIHEIVNPILMVIPMQMLAYEVALFKGLDIDMPRNLAKSVTVE